jgi:hypothetical protein
MSTARHSRVLLSRYDLDESAFDHARLTLDSYERLDMRLVLVLWATERTPYIPGPEGSILLEFIGNDECVTCSVSRDAVPYPGLTAQGAEALAWEISQTARGYTDHPTTTWEAKVVWLRSLAAQLRKLDRCTLIEHGGPG